MQSRCKGSEVQRQCRAGGAEQVQRWSRAGAEVLSRCREGDFAGTWQVQGRCRGAGVVQSRCRAAGAECRVQSAECRGAGAEVLMY